MSIFRQRDSLNWLSLFSVSEKEKKQTLQRIQQIQMEYDSRYFAYDLLQITGLNPGDFRTDDTATQIACETVALKFMIEDSDFAKDLLSVEDFEKAQSVFARKQLNSKLLKNLLSCFSKLLTDHGRECNLKNLFTLPILDQIKIAQEDEINRSFGALKKLVEKVSSGVKYKCYYEAEHTVRDFQASLEKSLHAFVIEQWKYDFHEAQNRDCRYSSTLFYPNTHRFDNSILQLALLDDKHFWVQHEGFCVVAFLNEVAKQNDLRHAEKLIHFSLSFKFLSCF